MDEYRRLYDDNPSSYPVIRKIAKEDGSIDEIPVFPTPHKKEFSWGDVVPNNENNPTIDWITNRVKLRGHMSSESDLTEFVQQTGAGKTTISRALLDREDNLRMSISLTTRPMRPSEVDGEDYYFVDEAKFKRMVEDGEFLEHAKVFGNYYGTLKKPVLDALSQGKDVLFDIDWQGTEQLKKNTKFKFSHFFYTTSRRRDS